MTIEQFKKAQEIGVKLTNLSKARHTITSKLNDMCLGSISYGESIPVEREFLRALYEELEPIITEAFNAEITKLETEFKNL